MSIQQDCPWCEMGKHDRHDEKHGIRPGLIGGTYCGCQGDCAERAIAAAHKLHRMFGGATPEEPAP